MRLQRMVLCAAVLGTGGLAALADDSPQWRGPARNGIHTDKGLLQKWPEGGPKLVWKNNKIGAGYGAKGLAGGYGSPSVVAGKVYVIGGKSGDEILYALSEKDGKELWSVKIGKVGTNKGPQYPGPRATPTVDGDRIYTLSSNGDLACVDAVNRRVVWEKNVGEKSTFGGKPGAWAYAESPLIDGDVVVVTPGGTKATLVALKKEGGEVVWRAEVPSGGAAGYASAIVAEAGGVRQYVSFLGNGLVGVDAKTGKYLWRYNGTSNSSANNPTPIPHESYVFSSSGGPSGGAGGLTKLTADGGKVKATEVYSTSKLKSNIGGHVVVGGHVYGGGGKGVVCADLMTGKEKWAAAGVGNASICFADGCLYLRGHGGNVALAAATPEAYRELGRFTPPRGNGTGSAWAYPVVANGCLYVRDHELLLCYDVKAGK